MTGTYISTDAGNSWRMFNLRGVARFIVLDPVDSSAAASWVALAQGQGVKVIAYDRPIPTAKADYYVSFDNQAIGNSSFAAGIFSSSGDGVLRMRRALSGVYCRIASRSILSF